MLLHKGNFRWNTKFECFKPAHIDVQLPQSLCDICVIWGIWAAIVTWDAGNPGRPNNMMQMNYLHDMQTWVGLLKRTSRARCLSSVLGRAWQDYHNGGFLDPG